jgi:hypothetical protein
VDSRRLTEVELTFIGDGRIVEQPPGVFHGGVPEPELGPQFGFNVLPMTVDETGMPNPEIGGGSYAGAMQINLWGTSADLRELGRYLLALAELDSSADPDFHQHSEDLISHDGRTRVDVIVRKVRSSEAASRL